MLSQRRSINLSTIILITMLMVAILPNIIFGILSAKMIQDSLISQTGSSSVLIADALADKMSLSFKEPLNVLLDIRAKVLSSGKAVQSLQNIGSNSAVTALFRRIELTGPEGHVIAGWPGSAGRIGVDLSGKQYGSEFSKGFGYFLSSQYVSYENGRPVVDLVIPCGTGQLVGTMEATMVQTYLASQRISQDAIIGIIDVNGVWLACTDLTLMNQNDQPSLTVEWAANPAGRQKISDVNGGQYLPYVERISNSEWSVVILSSVKFLQDSTENLKMGITFTVMILMIISFGLLVLVNRRVKGQTRQILDFAERISAGKYAFLVPPKMFREMEKLLEQFEEMARKIEKRETEINDKNRSIQLLNIQLEERVKDRTQQLHATNISLEKTLDELRDTQNQLIETERMANLGNLVAGVAHEINTPIGVSLTSATYLDQQIKRMKNWGESGQIKKSDMTAYINVFLECSQIITTNLNSASKLIRSFKQIAVDRSLGEIRSINIQEYLEGVVLSLKPELRNHDVTIHVEPENLHFNCNPGEFSQVVGNLLTNAVKHGFGDIEHGQIEIFSRIEDKHIILKISDNGAGISEENLKSIYEPFFTTKRGSGGTGLGLNIVYNIIRQKFGGNIHCESEQGTGTCFTITIPLTNEQ